LGKKFLCVAGLFLGLLHLKKKCQKTVDFSFFLPSGTLGPENLKKSWPKKVVKPNKSISRKKISDQIPFFAISKMAKNQCLNSGKKLKTAKKAISRRKIDLCI